jgi:hypothetical protein
MRQGEVHPRRTGPGWKGKQWRSVPVPSRSQPQRFLRCWQEALPRCPVPNRSAVSIDWYNEAVAKMASEFWKQRRSSVDSAGLLECAREHARNHHCTRRFCLPDDAITERACWSRAISAPRAPGESRTVSYFCPEVAEALDRGTEEDRGSSEEALGEAAGRQDGPSHKDSRQEAT